MKSGQIRSGKNRQCPMGQVEQVIGSRECISTAFPPRANLTVLEMKSADLSRSISRATAPFVVGKSSSLVDAGLRPTSR